MHVSDIRSDKNVTRQLEITIETETEEIEEAASGKQSLSAMANEDGRRNEEHIDEHITIITEGLAPEAPHEHDMNEAEVKQDARDSMSFHLKSNPSSLDNYYVQDLFDDGSECSGDVGVVIDRAKSVRNALESLKDGEGQSIQQKACDASPIEDKIFNEHTRCFGLFFKPWLVERKFLESYVKLHRNEVYLGYIVYVLVQLLGAIGLYSEQKYRDYACRPVYQSFCGTEDSFLSSIYSEGDVSIYFEVVIPVSILLALAGCLFNWYIHWSDRVKDKLWARLGPSVVYLILLVGGLAKESYAVQTSFPIRGIRYSLLIYAIIVLISGNPSFSFFFIYWIIGTITYIGSFVAILAGLQNSKEEVNRGQMTQNFIISINWYFVSSVLFLTGGYLLEAAARKQFLRGMLMADQEEEVIKQKTKNAKLQKKLLENMLPSFIVDKLQEQNFTMSSWEQLRNFSHRHFGVSIMFADLVGFTEFSAQVEPRQVMEYLNDLFLVFDNLCDKHDVYKVETVGDQYVAAVGVLTGQMLTEDVGHSQSLGSLGEDSGKLLSRGIDSGDIESDSVVGGVQTIRDASSSNTKQMLDFAKAIIAGARHVKIPMSETSPVLRVGIHTGSCISGIVGTKNLRFCLFGDTMNTAARMEQKSSPECIHTTQDVVDLIPDGGWEKLKKLEVKGKGTMQTYTLHVGNMLDDKDSLGCKTLGDAAGSIILSTVEVPSSPFFLKEKAPRSSNSSASGDPLRNPFLLALPPTSREGVSNKIYYSEHTKWFGLIFKNSDVELSYLDGLARLNKNVVYVGYASFFFVLLVNLISGFSFYTAMRHLCKDPAYFLMCDFIFDQTGDKSISYDDLINNALFRMTPECAATLLVLLSLGCFSQWFIHSSNRVKNKAWAIVCSALFYFALLLCVVVVIMVFGQMTKGELYFQWVYNIGTMIVILGKIDFSLSYSFVLTHYFFSFFFLRHYFFLLRRHDISNILIVLDTRVWSVLWIFHPSDC